MRTLQLLPTALGLAATALVQAQGYAPPDPSGLQGIIVERYYVADANDAQDTDGGGGLEEGAVTYRVYVDMKPGYKLLTVGGFTGHPIRFATTTTFFNNDDRGEAWGRDIGANHLNKNTVALDSWLTIGAASSAHWGVPKNTDADGSILGGASNDGGSVGVGLLANNAAAAGIPVTEADGLLQGVAAPGAVSYVGTMPDLFDAGGASSYENDDMAWAILGGVEGPDAENKILVGQFTTAGDFSFCLNVALKIPAELVCNNPNCHTFLRFYPELFESDTANAGYVAQNQFAFPTLCFNSADAPVDCANVPGGSALPGTACDDGNADTANDTYQDDCTCAGEDCLGVMGGDALPGAPCDDGDPGTQNDVWQSGCVCMGAVGIEDATGGTATLLVSPNPTDASTKLTLTGLQGDAISYVILDPAGRVLAQRAMGRVHGELTEQIDLAFLSSGTYLLQVRVGDAVRTSRLVVRR